MSFYGVRSRLRLHLLVVRCFGTGYRTELLFKMYEELAGGRIKPLRVLNKCVGSIPAISSRDHVSLVITIRQYVMSAARTSQWMET